MTHIQIIQDSVLNQNDLTRLFGSLNMAVDKLHFLNHRDEVRFTI